YCADGRQISRGATGFKLLIGACLLAILFLCLTLRKPAVQAAPQQAG
ncbi:hypothetical protein P3E16_18690, partial [Pseudomonas aeruginosa]